MYPPLLPFHAAGTSYRKTLCKNDSTSSKSHITAVVEPKLRMLFSLSQTSVGTSSYYIRHIELLWRRNGGHSCYFVRPVLLGCPFFIVVLHHNVSRPHRYSSSSQYVNQANVTIHALHIEANTHKSVYNSVHIWAYDGALLSWVRWLIL